MIYAYNKLILNDTILQISSGIITLNSEFIGYAIDDDIQDYITNYMHKIKPNQDILNIAIEYQERFPEAFI